MARNYGEIKVCSVLSGEDILGDNTGAKSLPGDLYAELSAKLKGRKFFEPLGFGEQADTAAAEKAIRTAVGKGELPPGKYAIIRVSKGVLLTPPNEILATVEEVEL